MQVPPGRHVGKGTGASDSTVAAHAETGQIGRWHHFEIDHGINHQTVSLQGSRSLETNKPGSLRNEQTQFLANLGTEAFIEPPGISWLPYWTNMSSKEPERQGPRRQMETVTCIQVRQEFTLITVPLCLLQPGVQRRSQKRCLLLPAKVHQREYRSQMLTSAAKKPVRTS